MQAFAALRVEPSAMVESDLDGDGISDLIVGYSAPDGGIITITRGNPDAFAPHSERSFKAIGRREFLTPFLSNSQSLNIPIIPDFLAVGSFTGPGHADLLVGSRNIDAIYIFPGDGDGKFKDPLIKRLPGTVTALAGGRLENAPEFEGVIIGLSSPQGSSLEVWERKNEALAPRASFPLKAPVSTVALGDLDGDSHPDAAVVSGNEVLLLHGSLMHLQRLTLPISVADLALGDFVVDRSGRLEMALLGTDGSIQLAAPAGFDPRVVTLEEIRARWSTNRRGMDHLSQFDDPVDPDESWQIIETYPAMVTANTYHRCLLFRSRISSNAADDVIVLDPSVGQLIMISHPDGVPGATQFTPGDVSIRPNSGLPVAALAMRVNEDGRPGVVTLNRGELDPSVLAPLTVNTYTVTGTGDTTPIPPCTGASPNISCPTLRGAIQAANANPGTDTVMIPAGTYTLALPRINGNYNGNQGTLEVLDSVNIVGAGQATTIIQGGPSIGNGVDMVMAVNEDIGTLTNATATISNLTIRFGTNRGSVAGFDGDGGGMEFDTGSSGNANLTLTNVTFDSNRTLDGNGAGLAVFNASSGPTGGNGLATLTNCIFTNNSAKEINPGATGSGGGMFVFDLARANISNTQFTNNIATGVGGGVGFFSAGQGSRTSNLHAATITGNTAGTDGGGVYSASNLLIDSGTLIDNNQATGGVNVGLGGGVRVSVASPDTVTLTKVTISNNKATNGGGGLASGNGSGGGPAVIQFSRFANNTLTGAGSGTNINNNHSSITATNNWWGTNSPAATIFNTVATTTFDPFIVLTHTANPSKIRINQSTTLTADMSKDNHGNSAALAGNLDRIIGLPVTFGNAVFGTIPEPQPETLNTNAQATATFNAGATSGLGHADVTLDQATVTVNIPVLEPLRIVKSFGAALIPINGTTTLNFAITNPNVIAVDGSFTDSLPANMQVAATPSVTNSCGGTVTAAANATTVSFSNASVAVGACSISVNVTATADNVYNNSVTINSTDAGNGALSTSSANLTVINPPHIVKAFGASPIRFGGTTTLTFTLDSNSNQNLTLNGVAFTDTLQSGLKVATPSNVSTTCSNGTATAVNGSSSISLSGANVAPITSCTVTVTVVSTAVGTVNNSVLATSTNGGSSTTANASISVIKADTNTTVTSSVNPSVFGQSVTYTATVSAVAPGVGAPTGIVTFIDGGNSFGTGTLSSGKATFTTSALSVGNHTITTSYGGDSSFNGSSGSLTGNPQVVSQVTTNALDAKVVEPAAGTANMLFTIALSAPASQTITVNYATANGNATAGTCGSVGADYQTTSGTVTFNPGQELKTISVAICADGVVEPDETLLLNLSNPSNATMTRAQAVGTITQSNAPGTLVISELRTSGPAGVGDDFVELYNNTDIPLTINDTSGGYGLFKMGSDCDAVPIRIAQIPNGTLIPARGHYLLVGSQYSLASYATGDQTLAFDIQSDANLALFSTSDLNNISSANRLDAVGFGTNTGGAVCDLLREGNSLPQVMGSTTEYSFFRKDCDFVSGVGCSTPGNPKDTNNNAADFKFADTQGTTIPGGPPPQLGAPGPESKNSPIRHDSTISIHLLDAKNAQTAPPNRVRDLTVDPANNATFGTLSMRRRITNNTGGSVTRLRYRIVELTTFPTPGGQQADIRALTAPDVSITGVLDPATCNTTGTPVPGPPPCTVIAHGTTLEMPPNQTKGGGLNSTLASGTVALGTPLANEASINVQFVLGVQQPGNFRFLIIIEALP